MDYLKFYESRFKETELIFDSLPIAVFAINQIFRVIRLNETALRLLDAKDYQDVVDDLCYKRIHSRNDICPFCPLTNEWNQIDFHNKKFFRLEKVITKKENHNEEKIYKVSFILISKGSLRMIEIIEDITKEIEKQEERIRIENLAALGIMISGIAHELNNPLTGISLNLQNLISNLGSYECFDEEKKQEILYRLRLIQKDVLKASHIVSDILSLNRPGIKEKHRLELQKIVLKAKKNTIRLYPVLSKKITWDIQETSPIFIFANADKLERMFFNLFRNSLQAYDYKQGVIGVRFKVYKNKVLIIVYDEAGGIPEEILKKLFIPFASARTTTKGTGLGLTICYNIVKEHQGKIKVRSYSGKTIFFILLPLAIYES